MDMMCATLLRCSMNVQAERCASHADVNRRDEVIPDVFDDGRMNDISIMVYKQ